jgi:hypothetical protein
VEMESRWSALPHGPTTAGSSPRRPSSPGCRLPVTFKVVRTSCIEEGQIVAYLSRSRPLFLQRSYKLAVGRASVLTTMETDAPALPFCSRNRSDVERADNVLELK